MASLFPQHPTQQCAVLFNGVTIAGGIRKDDEMLAALSVDEPNLDMPRELNIGLDAHLAEEPHGVVQEQIHRSPPRGHRAANSRSRARRTSSARSAGERGLGWTTPVSGTIRFAIETGGPAICFKTSLNGDPRSAGSKSAFAGD
jgi:hypothetical protein